MNGRVAMVAVVLGLMSAGVPAATRAYFVEPRELHTGKVAGDEAHGIRQSFVANIDSIAYIEWFVGELSAEGQYLFEIREQGTNDLVCAGAESVPTRGWQWVKCDSFSPLGSKRFTKGREYLLKVSHDGGDSVNFVYRTDDPYEYGAIPNDIAPNPADLCARVVGYLDSVDSTYWGVQPYYPWSQEYWNGSPNDWDDRAVEAGVHLARFEVCWVWVQPDSPPDTLDGFDFSAQDSQFWCLKDSLEGCETFALLKTCPEWASTYFDSLDTLGDSCWSVNCPPRNLWPDAGEVNYWAVYVESVVRHYDAVATAMGTDSIHTYEISNEPNLRWTFWRPPNARDYDSIWGDTTAWTSCSFYLRLAYVADSVITRACGPAHAHDRVLVGSMSEVEAETPDTLHRRVKGKDWLRFMYQLTDTVFWTGVAVHPYQGDKPFDAIQFQREAETLRHIMRGENGDFGELWITEVGWTTEYGSYARQADAVLETFASTLASEAQPAGGYDRVCWYSFRDTRNMRFGFLDTLITDRKPSFYGFKQAGAMLTGKRLNGRVMLGDERDEDVRIYEFGWPATTSQDDTGRLWVCWKNGGTTGDSVVDVPVRSDDVRVDSLHYTGDEDPTNPTPGADGWLEQTLTTRPVFIRETGEVERPDLVADSVWSVPAKLQVSQQCSLCVRVVNHGSAETGGGSSNPPSPNTVARFYVDDGLIGSWEHAPSIGIGDTVKLAIAWTPNSAVVGLLRATVNDDQAYVEESMDDNAAYRLLAVSY